MSGNMVFKPLEVRYPYHSTPDRLINPPLIKENSREARKNFIHKTPVIPKINNPPPLLRKNFLVKGGGYLSIRCIDYSKISR